MEKGNMAKESLTLDDLSAEGEALALNPRYLQLMGWFQSAWASIEVNTDFAICRFLGVTYEQAHLITAGMMFGRKARLLADLIAASDHPKKDAIIRAFNSVREGNKRNVFAHGYIATDKDSVTFIERTAGKAKAKQHHFTLQEFEAHVVKFVRAGERFHDVLEIGDQELEDFASAAWPLDE
jgi:hypothetical protein